MDGSRFFHGTKPSAGGGRLSGSRSAGRRESGIGHRLVVSVLLRVVCSGRWRDREDRRRRRRRPRGGCRMLRRAGRSTGSPASSPRGSRSGRPRPGQRPSARTRRPRRSSSFSCAMIHPLTPVGRDTDTKLSRFTPFPRSAPLRPFGAGMHRSALGKAGACARPMGAELPWPAFPHSCPQRVEEPFETAGVVDR
jgi:hypothetical protein